MNRFLGIFNLLGVVMLTVLCIAQWQNNSSLENQVAQLQRTDAEQSAKIAEQQMTLKNDAIDLEDLRQRLSMSESSLQTMTAEKNRLAAESQQLKAALATWMAAVKARDAALRQASGLIQKLAGERNDAIAKFNDLADKYNALVKQVNSGK
jgi:chromosome segregation ATPase